MILVFDIGKTNKKCFVFDEDYQVVFEQSTQLPEITDEDGEPCEGLSALVHWVLYTGRDLLNDPRWSIRAVNVATYGASLVHLNANGQVVTPLYNYLKSFPETLKEAFFERFGPAERLSLETASPVLGMLNSGLQLYWLKQMRPAVFAQIACSMHLPQFMATLFHGHTFSEMTSLGCHTMLWNVQKKRYHPWALAEGIAEKFPALVPGDHTVPVAGGLVPRPVICGMGLHDSSAALIPYLACFREPFILISTGTWCITLNPFNDEPLTAEELARDCLCYLTFEGQPVKAARFFGGHEHDQAVQQIAADYGLPADFYNRSADSGERPGPLIDVQNALDEYAAFMRQFIERQAASTRLALGNTAVRRIFVDGGFSKNKLYMNLLARAFAGFEVFASEVPQATALGAAMVIHQHWNHSPLPSHLIPLQPY